MILTVAVAGRAGKRVISVKMTSDGRPWKKQWVSKVEPVKPSSAM